MCPMCGSYEVGVCDQDHWKCRECGWIFLKEDVGKEETKDAKGTTKEDNAGRLEAI